MKMSRRAIPYTPANHELAEMTIALVSTAGVYIRGQEPFDPDNDITYRLIPPDIPGTELLISHGHYDHADADIDINCVFPIDRLRELVAAGVIAAVADKNFGLGYSPRLREMYEVVAPKIADELERSRADAAFLTAG